jgi:hypothetical protein
MTSSGCGSSRAQGTVTTARFGPPWRSKAARSRRIRELSSSRRHQQRIAHRLIGKPIPTLQRQHGDRRLPATQRDWALIAKLAIDHLVIAIDRLQKREDTRDHD